MRLLCWSSLGLAVAVSATMALAPAQAGTVNAAVAANFAEVAEQLGADFKAASGHDLVFSFGATGALYTQITQAAPFDVFFSADAKRTQTAIDEGFAVAGTDFTYAVGRLVLYSPTIDVTDGAAVLKGGAFRHLAIASPRTAPYGAAAIAVLEALGLTEAVTSKIVTGENITQAQLFVESGSAELGFVALSQVIGKPSTQTWLPPRDLYPVIRQNAVLLKAGESNEAAKAFLDYVKSDAAVVVIRAAGYELE
jgi:molybdate transport system substrate-binding protein